jgi:outer membrane protein assembly factor BamB
MVAASVILLASATLHAENWPAWRGPSANGISKETGLPTHWGEDKNIAWKLPMPGIGGSTPIVYGDRIFLTSGDDKDLVLLCVKTDGKLLWKEKIASAARLIIRKDEGNEASATPCTDGKNVIVFVGTGDLASFTFEGKLNWKINVQDRYGKFSIQHGMHSTPVLHENRLYMNLIHSNGHWVLCFDAANGKELWKVHRKSDAESESKEAYTTPSLAKSGKETYLVVHGADYTTGHRLSDGAELWRLTGLNPKDKYQPAFRIIASPVVVDDLIVIPTCRGQQVIAVKPDASGEVKPGTPAEQWRVMKGAPDVPSPLVHEGLVYLCRENGFLLVLDAKTGSEIYHERLHDSRHRASPVYADGKIYLTARDGTFNVVKAGRRFDLLATNRLPEEFTASPAISGGRIYLRGFKTLYAISEGGK